MLLSLIEKIQKELPVWIEKLKIQNYIVDISETDSHWGGGSIEIKITSETKTDPPFCTQYVLYVNENGKVTRIDYIWKLKHCTESQRSGPWDIFTYYGSAENGFSREK